MRISPLVVSIGALAALSGWLVRGIQLNAETSPLPQPVTKAVAAQSADVPLQLSVDRPVDLSHTAGSTRNLFAYRELEIPRARPAVFQPPPAIVDAPVVPPPVIVPAIVETRPRLRFTHRYIGRFGPKDRPIAAFARDGEIVTVKVGGRIDDHFVLRSVGIESVEVEASVNGEFQTEHVALSSSL